MTRHIGIFFHYQQGERLRDFPQALDGILQDHRTMLYDAHYPDKPPAGFQLQELPQDLLCQVHAPAMVAQVAKSELYQSALYSAGGVVQAAEKLRTGEIDNAFVFTGCGDHHAGWSFYGGGCYLNGAALAIAHLRRLGARRFAIIDTDVHHGDGTQELFERDEEVLYLCLCSAGFAERNHKVNIPIPWHTSDKEYLQKVAHEFAPRAHRFQPEVIFWNWGYDGTQGEYGDIGLSPDCHHKLAKLLKGVAEETSEGRLVAILCGGSSQALATYAIPHIIRCLCGLGVNE